MVLSQEVPHCVQQLVEYLKPRQVAVESGHSFHGVPLGRGPNPHPRPPSPTPEYAETAESTSPQAAETKPAGAGQIREREGEMLYSGAGGLPGSRKGSQRPGHPTRVNASPLHALSVLLILCPSVWGPGHIGP